MTKRQLDLRLRTTKPYTKLQLNTSKHVEKGVENDSKSKKGHNSFKIWRNRMKLDESRTWSVTHNKIAIYKTSAEYIKACRKKGRTLPYNFQTGVYKLKLFKSIIDTNQTRKCVHGTQMPRSADRWTDKHRRTNRGHNLNEMGLFKKYNYIHDHLS